MNEQIVHYNCYFLFYMYVLEVYAIMSVERVCPKGRTALVFVSTSLIGKYAGLLRQSSQNSSRFNLLHRSDERRLIGGIAEDLMTHTGLRLSLR